jgi:hypothetical protein
LKLQYSFNASRDVPRPVFVGHSSRGKPAVKALALALGARGIDPWLDKWGIGAGDDIVAGINAGLEVAGPASVFSCHSRESRWVEAEVSYLTYAGIQENKVLIPVVLGADAYVLLLRPLARRDSGAARDSSGSWSSSSVSV